MDFDKVQDLDEPELVAARWWRDGPKTDGVSRRGALMGLAGLSAMTALSNSGCGGSSAPSGPTLTAENALALQKQHGWDFGAGGLTLNMGSSAKTAVDPAVLDGLATALKPTNPTNQTFASLVLFDALKQSTAGAKDLKSVIRPIHTPQMDNAELSGRGLSTLFDGAPAGRAVIVDLPGPESVAFAAGLANRFDPVFYFDNWPHPKGTVPSHLTLAAAIDYAPTFESMAAARPATAPPAFILDSNRLAPFTDKQFDNRYVANLPSAATLEKMQITQIMLVRPTADSKDLDDVNAVLAEYAKKGIKVELVPLARFESVPEAKVEEHGEAVADTETDHSDAGSYESRHRHRRYNHYGGSGSHWLFWAHYGFGRPRYGYSKRSWSRPTFKPTARSTQFGGAATPAGFGKVNVDKSGRKTSLSSTQDKGAPGRSRTRGGSSGGRSSGGSWGRSRGGGYS